MTRVPYITSLALRFLIASFVVTGCFAAEVQTKAMTSSSHPCPMPDFKMPPPPATNGAVGPPPGPMMASSVAPSDTSTSIVIHPDPKDQITCGKTSLKTISDVVFAVRPLPDGKSINLSLDIQIPEPAKKRPLVVYVTGGGFVISPKEAALNLRTYVAEAGFVVASIQYRTFPNGANYRDGVADVKSAVRYLRANADKYGIDPRKIAIWGESAGGYLVAMAGVTNDDKAFDVGDNLDQSSAVQAVVNKFGATDTSLLGMDFDAQMQAIYSAPTNPIFLYTPRGDAAANPITHINKSTAPPFLIFHGSQDRLISPSQTLMLHKSLLAAGVSSKRYVLDGANHGDLAFMGNVDAGLPWSTNQTMGIIVDFLKQTLGSDKH